MTRNITSFAVTLILSALLSLVLPWWSVMIAALVTSLLIPLEKASAFFMPFLAILLFWSLYSFALSSGNDFTLAKKISQLLKIGGNPYILMLMTGFIGGLAAGVSGVLGKQVLALTKKE